MIQARKHITHGEIIDQFRQAMAAAGVAYTGQITADNDKINRFTVEGDRKSALTGWYVLHTDGIPAGEFGCWKRGIQTTWCSAEMNTLTDDERRQLEQRRHETQRRREQKEIQRHAQAADKARTIWDAAEQATVHPYLTRKGVAAFGLRVGRWTRENEDGQIWLDVPNALLIPIRDGKKIVSLQAIFPDKENASKRDKDFLSGGKKRGCFFAIGKPASEETDPVIVICEGYSTGASIHMATGYPVIVAFDNGNLMPVAERVRAKFPGATLIVAADNDRWTTQPVQNPGVHFGRLAADGNRAWLAVPDFENLDSKPTDFNDLHRMHGLESVAEQIIAAVRPAPPPSLVENSEAANDNTTDLVSPRTVDWITPLFDVNGHGRPLSTIENLAEICRRMGVIIRYNVITKEEEILIPGESFSLDNAANASLAMIMSWCGRFRMPTGQIGDYVTYLADKNLHNPVANWVLSNPWDGKNRLSDLYATVVAVGEEDDVTKRMMKEILMRRWLISAVAGAFEPTGVSAHGVLVFQGPQYLGKTAWFKSLVPKDLGVIADGLMLKPDDRDSVKQAVSNWLVELGELDATFRKSDIAQLKSFLTRDRDTLRRAYARRESTFARRTVFFASVNPKEFLHDQTGNRRYWTIECQSLNHRHGLDMQQVWAQVHHDYAQWLKQGKPQPAPWFLTPEELDQLNDENQNFEVVDPIQERIISKMDWTDPPSIWEWKTSTEILVSVGVEKPTQSEATRAASIIRTMNGNRAKRSSQGRLLLVPRLIRLT